MFKDGKREQQIANPQLTFSEKNDDTHAKKYFQKRQEGFWHRLSNWRETTMLRKAPKLAGNPEVVLDLPSGTGRFWEMFGEDPQRQLIAADNSLSMVATGMRLRPTALTQRVAPRQCSAFSIPLKDRSVKSVFRVRLLHHVGESEHRVILPRKMA